MGRLLRYSGIPWSDTLLETTKWGQDYNNEEGFAKGYDVTPVYKIYPEYISALDQLRIQICNADFQKKIWLSICKLFDIYKKGIAGII